MAVTVSVDTTHYSCVVLWPKTTAPHHFIDCETSPDAFFFPFSLRVGDGESGRTGKIGGCLGSGGGLVLQ